MPWGWNQGFNGEMRASRSIKNHMMVLTLEGNPTTSKKY